MWITKQNANLQRNKKNVKRTKCTKNWTQSLDVAIVLVYMQNLLNSDHKAKEKETKL